MMVLVAAIGLLAMEGCDKEEDQTSAYPYQIIAEGNLYGNGQEGLSKQNLVIKTDSAWNSLKAQLNSANYTVDDVDFDFYSSMLIAVIDEVKENGGWTIDVTNIIETDNEIVVTVSNLQTGDDSAVITQPFQIVKLHISNKNVRFTN